VTIREQTTIGEHCRVGTLSDIQEYCRIGRYTRLHSIVHIQQESRIGDFVWIVPYTVLTNDPLRPRMRSLA
jgi:UDP-3-O-[3-hydroxymyristoyl] glucosamine N-acyltransferase